MEQRVGGWDRKGKRGARGICGTEGRRMGQGGIDCGEGRREGLEYTSLKDSWFYLGG